MNCRVMGIVNVTPDSFSDGGRYCQPEEAIRRARNLVEEGAAVIDIGGESTRPGATPIGWDEEWARIEPVVSSLAAIPQHPQLSVDTYHPETAERAIAVGVDIVNCVYGEYVPEMVRVIASADKGTELIIPSTFLAHPSLLQLSPSSIYIDPMIGFGTTREEDLALLKSIPALVKKGRVVVGASRKRIVKKLIGEKTLGKDLAGNLAIALYAAMQGASLVRVHDVRETIQALKVLKQLL